MNRKLRLAKAERTFRAHQLRTQKAWIQSLGDEELRALAGDDPRLASASRAQLEGLVREADCLFLDGLRADEIETCCEKIVAPWRSFR